MPRAQALPTGMVGGLTPRSELRPRDLQASEMAVGRAPSATQGHHVLSLDTNRKQELPWLEASVTHDLPLPTPSDVRPGHSHRSQTRSRDSEATPSSVTTTPASVAVHRQTTDQTRGCPSRASGQIRAVGPETQVDFEELPKASMPIRDSVTLYLGWFLVRSPAVQTGPSRRHR